MFLRKGTFMKYCLSASNSLAGPNHQGKLLPPASVAAYGGTSQVSSTTNLTSVNLSMGYYNLKLPDDYTVRVHLIF